MNQFLPLLTGSAIFVIVIVILGLVILAKGVVVVPQGRNITIERLGRFTRTLLPGLNIIIPFIDRVGARLNMMEQVLDVPTQEVITRDNAQVSVDGVVFFQVFDPYKASYEVTDLQRALLNLTMTNIRSVMGSMDLDNLLSNRDEINERLLKVVDLAAEPWGIRITRIEIKDIQPPTDLINAMARQMKAEREKRAAILEAEGVREAEIRRAEGMKQAQILQAEGRREAAFRDAEAREREAEAEAKATQLVSTAIAEGDINAVNYFVAQGYVKALEGIATSNNQKLLMMPMDTAGLMGSIAGIAEIAKDSLSERSEAKRTRGVSIPRSSKDGTS